jgi:hypothetical protein
MVQELPKNQTVALLGEAIEIEQDNNTDENKSTATNSGLA